jgi:hypothetical protein
MYDAYGDESCGQEFVGYGVLVVPEHKVASAETITARIKVEFGGGAEQRLHCREMFAGHARAKGPWAKLSMVDVFHLYNRLFEELNVLKLRRLVAVARKADFPNEVPSLAMEHVDPVANVPPIFTKAFAYGDKQIAIHCAQATMIPLAKYPGLEMLRFWPDPDSTTIEWFTGRRVVKGEVGNFFVDMGPGQEPPKVKVMPTEGPKPTLLEVADAIAYVSQRSLTSSFNRNTQRFKALAHLIQAEQIRMGIAPDGGLGFNIPNATLAYKPE